MKSNCSIASGAFTSEQKEYLSGFFAGAAQRMRPFVGVTADGLLSSDPACGATNHAEATEDMVHGTPVSELCREERWKAEQNPLDIWDKLIAHAEANQAPQTEDVFRFKFHGLFYVAPARRTRS